MTGIARYTVELTRALSKIEPDLEIILLNPYPESDHPWYQEFPSHPLPHLRKLPLAATLGNLELHRAATRLRLDILHDPCGIAPFLAPKGGYLRVTTIHDALPAVYPQIQQLLTRMVFATLVKRAGSNSDAIFTVSQASAADLIKFYKFPAAKVHVTLEGVAPPNDLSRKQVEKAMERLGVVPPFLMSVGALHPRKNIQRILKAFAIVHRTHPEAKLVIAGPPSWGENEEFLSVRDAVVGDSGVVFTGYIGDLELGALYQRTHGLVFPALYEGFGLPVLEAMSHGAPVLTSNVSSLPEVAGDAAILVDPTSVDEIAKGMRRLLEDEDLRIELSHKGRSRSQTFSWQATAMETLRVYHLLLDQAG
ncbi:glycosyltransferase family 4 protein [Desulfurivibrio alkaliphilus]|nr:glycosyltransferase family 1 protein [Desulfurivibrio alkaliphilus]